MATTTIEPFRLAQDYVYAFLFESADTRVLIVPDETLGWIPDGLRGLDLAILPMGVNEFNPLTGERTLPATTRYWRQRRPFRRHWRSFARLMPGG